MTYTQNSEQVGQVVQTFTNPAFGSVRTAGTAENPQFCLADLCKILGLSVKGVNQRLDKEVISNYPLPTAGGVQQMNFVNEDGLYDVILDSRKPEAKAFRKWVTSEVLPAIRRQGGYIQAGEQDSDADIMARALMIAQKTIDSKQQRIQMLEGERDTLQQQNRLLAPKAQYTDEVLQSTSTITFTELAKELNFRRARAAGALRQGPHPLPPVGALPPDGQVGGQGFLQVPRPQVLPLRRLRRDLHRHGHHREGPRILPQPFQQSKCVAPWQR